MPDFKTGPFGNYYTPVTPAGEKINIPFGSENAGGKLGVTFSQGTHVKEIVGDNYLYDSGPTSPDTMHIPHTSEVDTPPESNVPENAGGKLGVTISQDTQVEEIVEDGYNYDSYPNPSGSIVYNPDTREVDTPPESNVPENAGEKLGATFPQDTQVEEVVDDDYHYNSYPNSFDSIIHNPLYEINVPEKEQKIIDTENPHEYSPAKFDSGGFEADKFSPMKDEGQVDEFSPMKDEGHERTRYRYNDASYALHKDTAALQDLLEDLPAKESVLGSILTPDNFVPPSAAYASLTRTSESGESIRPHYTFTFDDVMHAVVEEAENIALVPIDYKQNLPVSWKSNSVYGSVDTNIYTPKKMPYRYVMIWVPGKEEESVNWLSLVNILEEQGVKNLSDTKFIFPTSEKGLPMNIEKLQRITYSELGQYIPSKHIFVGGHKDGGVLAAQLFFTLKEPLGGLITTSMPSMVTIKKLGSVPNVDVHSEKPADTSTTAAAAATVTVAPTTSTQTATRLRIRESAQKEEREEEEEKEEVTKEEREVRDTETKNLLLKFLRFIKQKLVNFKRRLFNYIANSRQWLTSKFTKTPKQKENNEVVIYYNEFVKNRLDAPIYLGVDDSTLPQVSEGQQIEASAFKDLGFSVAFCVHSSSKITKEDVRNVASFLNEYFFADVATESETTHL